MNAVQKFQLKQSELKVKLTDLLEIPVETRAESFAEDLGKLTAQVKAVEGEVQAALLAQPDVVEKRAEEKPTETSEEKEIAELRGKADFGRYIAGALSGGGVRNGAELEYNQALGIPEDRFSLEMLTRNLPKLETRAAVVGDAMASQASWVDRLFADSAAMRLGITFPSVAPGVATFPVMTGGSTPSQRGIDEAATGSTYTMNVNELKPTRNAVHGTYQIEDSARLPGLSDAIMRDMRAGMVAQIDKTIFVGDSGASGTDADIAGLNTISIGEKTLTQSNSVKGDKILEAFLDWVDGIYATTIDDVRIVASVGSNKLWGSTIQAATVENQTLGQFLRASGVAWTVKADVAAGTGNNAFGAFAGLQRGIQGAGVAPVWMSAQMTTDPYSNAAKGNVALTLSYLWNFALPRTSNFKRLKYVT